MIKKELKPLMQVSEIDLIYKSKVRPRDRPTIKSSKDAFDILISAYDKNKIELVEQFFALFVNRANKVLAIYCVSSGGITGTVADPRLIFSAGLLLSAVGCLICHNHPSQNPRPSEADIELTKRMKAAGELLEIKLLDHLIITDNEGYFSMTDHGII